MKNGNFVKDLTLVYLASTVGTLSKDKFIEIMTSILKDNPSRFDLIIKLIKPVARRYGDNIIEELIRSASFGLIHGASNMGKRLVRSEDYILNKHLKGGVIKMVDTNIITKFMNSHPLMYSIILVISGAGFLYLADMLLKYVIQIKASVSCANTGFDLEAWQQAKQMYIDSSRFKSLDKTDLIPQSRVQSAYEASRLEKERATKEVIDLYNEILRAKKYGG